MRRVLAAAQLLGFLVAGIALTAPDLSRLIWGWSEATIYPAWAALYVVVGVVASVVSILHGRTRALMMPTLSVVLAAQLAGLGLVAVKHWKPSFGMGGGYAGEPDDLVTLAWIVGIAGTTATAAAIAQLVVAGAFPVRTSRRDAILFGGVGTLILLLLPFGIAEGETELQDVTSIGAFVLIYSAPIGLTVAGAGWVRGSLRLPALASSAVAAGLSALVLMTDLSFLQGRPALLATALLLGALTVTVALSSRPSHPLADVAPTPDR